MFFEVIGLKLIGVSLEGAGALMRGIGKLSGLSDEDLEVEKIKVKRQYGNAIKQKLDEDKVAVERYWGKKNDKNRKQAEMKKRAYARVLAEEQEERR